MSTMSMNKVIHAAIRRDLDRFEKALQSFPADDAARAEQLGKAWDNFNDELTVHHTGEHEIAWPALEQVGVTRETLAQMDSEHETMAAALGEAHGAIAALRMKPGTEEVATALSAIQQLRKVTVDHLDHEEQEIEPVFQANVDSPAMKDMARKFSRAQSLPRAGRFFAWVTDGATPEERAAVGDTVPKPVLALLSLFGRSYRKEIAPTWTA
jgi:hemerythrin-like domain-containing protein